MSKNPLYNDTSNAEQAQNSALNTSFQDCIPSREEIKSHLNILKQKQGELENVPEDEANSHILNDPSLFGNYAHAQEFKFSEPKQPEKKDGEGTPEKVSKAQKEDEVSGDDAKVQPHMSSPTFGRSPLALHEKPFDKLDENHMIASDIKPKPINEPTLI